MPENASPFASKLFLLKEMVARDVRARYAGSGLGILWAFAMPILWMLLYTGVFGLVLRVPVDRVYSTFPEFLMAGLLPWMAISEGISRSSSCLIDNAPMVKKTVFPLEMLVLSVVLAAMVNEVIALAVYGVYVALLGHLSPAWLWLVVPALVLQGLLTFGLGCIAATLTVFLRDTAHAIGIALTVAFYATPIVYPASLVPARFRPWIEAIPVSALVDLYRRAFTLHALPPAAPLAGLAAASALTALAGAALFSRARPHFADLL
ncbi:MAG TPA: ABC transporter permease [Thermoanaerobaculia bacterium]|nr:ABC transporter permease [Thermoanaerobaculia bacterium]